MSKADNVEDPVTIGAFPDSESESLAQSFTQQSIWQAVHSRRPAYSVPRQVRVKIGTWNIAAGDGTEKDLARWFVEGQNAAGAPKRPKIASADNDRPKKSIQQPMWSTKPANVGAQEAEDVGERAENRLDNVRKNSEEDDIGIYVLGLQEIVDINSPTETFRPFTDPGPSQRWKAALMNALPSEYEVVAEQQLVGILLLVAASSSIAPQISSVSTTSIGTGLLGYLGNKGAVAARLVLGETTKALFVNCHLAAGAEKASLDRRNWDAAQVIQRAKFAPIVDESGANMANGEVIGDEDVGWWFGDLNYRIDGLSGDDVRRLLTLHTRNEYRVDESPGKEGRHEEETLGSDVTREENARDGSYIDRSSPDSGKDESDRLLPSNIRGTSHDRSRSTTPDPASLATTLSSLLPHDQLRHQQMARKVLHEGWREGPIAFLPSYKYDIGTVCTFDSSEKRRAPSWCDRILFRTRQDILRHAKRTKMEGKTEQQGKETGRDGSDGDASNKGEDVLFDYDPETDGVYDEDDGSNGVSQCINGIEVSAVNDDKLYLASYSSHQQVSSSDHKPISAVFTLSYDAVVPELKKKVYDEVTREVDRAENAGRPGVTLVVEQSNAAPRSEGGQGNEKQQPNDSNTIRFGTVHYSKEAYRNVTIANTSRVLTRFYFTNESDSVDVLPSWMTCQVDNSDTERTSLETLSNKEMSLAPGDTLSLTFHVCVDNMKLLRSLNDGGTKLEHLMILHVVGGRDHFIPVQGSWMQSTFGRSLDELVKLPEGGVRALKGQSKSDSRSNEAEGRRSVPSAIILFAEAIDALASRVGAEWSAAKSEKEEKAAPWEADPSWPFSSASWTLKDRHERHLHKLSVHEALDTHNPLCSPFRPPTITPMEQLEIVTEVLTDFLMSLKDGIITAFLWADIERASISRQKSRKSLPHAEGVGADDEQPWIFDCLSASPIHNVSFVFLTTMLSHVISELAQPKGQGDSSSQHHSSMEVPPKGSSNQGSSATSTAEEVSPSSRPSDAQRRLAHVRAYAEFFAPVLIRSRLPAREKDRRTAMGRRKHVIEVFLSTG